MAKLSHIEDIELKRAQEALQQAQDQDAQHASQAAVAHEEQTAHKAQDDKAREQDDAPQAASLETPDPQGRMTAQQEADFHGVDASKPMGIGHKFLIILAVLVTIAALLYIVNSWVHFI